MIPPRASSRVLTTVSSTENISPTSCICRRRSTDRRRARWSRTAIASRLKRFLVTRIHVDDLNRALAHRRLVLGRRALEERVGAVVHGERHLVVDQLGGVGGILRAHH